MVIIQSKEEIEESEEKQATLKFITAIVKRMPLIKRTVEAVSLRYDEGVPTWSDICDYLEDVVSCDGVGLKDMDMINSEIKGLAEIGQKYGEIVGTITNLLKALDKIKTTFKIDFSEFEYLEDVNCYCEEKLKSLDKEFRELNGYVDRMLQIQILICQSILDKKKKDETKQAAVSSGEEKA